MSPIRMSKLESAVRIVLEFNQAFNRYDVADMMRLMSADCVFENTDPAPDGTLYAGKEAVNLFGNTSSASRPRRTSRSKRFLAWASAASCAGAIPGWIRQITQGMSAESTSSG